MKKRSILILMVSLTLGVSSVFSQSGRKPAAKKSSSAKAKTAGATAISKADIEKGKSLLSQSDCMACHQIQTKTVGPAYNDVADKYESTPVNINKLAQKVIKGGTGVWGQIPMAPHPTLKEADAKKMVAYILSLKTK